jgi:two-component system nitrogen regulation sensor histidine kinase NtrY
MAIVPTITVAIFATLSVNMGLEAWFSARVQSVIDASFQAAQSYQSEQRRALRQDAETLSRDLYDLRLQQGFVSAQDLSFALRSGQNEIQRGLKEAFIVDPNGDIILRGENSYLFDFEQPSPAQIDQATSDIVIIDDWANNEMRALVFLLGYTDRYLYITREIDGNLLRLLDDTQQTAEFYRQREADRGRVLFDFGILYLGFAVLMIVASVLMAVLFAERLSRPIIRLSLAARKVGEGDLDTQVVEEGGDDDISALGQYFNQMTRQLKQQRDTLIENSELTEERRRLFDSVLSSVTSGVVVLDAQQKLTFLNKSAQRLLGVEADTLDKPLAVVVPEFAHLLVKLSAPAMAGSSVQEETKLIRNGRLEHLLVRVAPRVSETGGSEGVVIAFDDVTDLVSAQRSAAWGDVARRIAHEIKNPLTPIQLSAERIKRKFSPLLGSDSDQLESMTAVIIRQTNDLRRIVDEFSKFARMPEPEKRQEDLCSLVADSVLLQENGQPDVIFETGIPSKELIVDLDRTMMSQALINLLKNAGEAIENRIEKGIEPNTRGRIKVDVKVDTVRACIQIQDNGTGLPQDRARLFEPYVTTRDKGTGLGLAIVKKIVEEHGGTLRLDDAEIFEGSGIVGAKVIIELPITQDIPSDAQGQRDK